MTTPKIKIGNRYGRWRVLEKAESYREPSGHLRHVWLCECECGVKRNVKGASLLSGRSLSCGCILREKNVSRMSTHGMYGTRIYKIWEGMKSRCDNPNNSRYKNYGGRGITYCKEWEDFCNFEEWALSNGYEDNLTLDRIDVNGNYEPDNCRWITNKEQQNNKRDNIYIPYKGVTKTLAEWSEITGKSYACLTYRYKAGWSAERIIETPIDKKHWSKKRRETNE